jgi:hypothetical protein
MTYILTRVFQMLKKLCAVGLLALAVCPFTAPFQTCDLGSARIPRSSTRLIDSASALPDESDPGSLVAPRSTAPGRLTIAPLPGPARMFFVISRSLAFFQHPVTAAAQIGDRSSNPPPVLRL